MINVNPLRQAAGAYAAHGKPVFPCGPNKRPLTARGFKDATTDQQQIGAWWTEHPSALIGIPTGQISGIVVLDVDVKEGRDGNDTLHVLERQHGKVPDTVEVLTPTGGRHLYFRPPEGLLLRNSQGALGIGLDIRAEGGYVIVPPSTIDGRAYEWEASNPPQPAAMPAWLIGLCDRSHAPAASNPGAAVPIPKGQRNGRLTSLAGAMRRQGALPAEIEAALREANATRCNPPLPPTEVSRIAASVGRYQPPDAEDWPDPQPLPTGLPPVQPFAFDLLPASLRPWVEDIAERLQCPPDFPAVGAVISLAAVVGRRIGIRPKRQDEWMEVPNLWGAVVGRPGIMKTPAISEAMCHLNRLEAAARADHHEAIREHEITKLVAEEKAKIAKGKVGEALKRGDEDAREAARSVIESTDLIPPVRRRYLTNDATVEKIGELLRDNPNGILAHRDELVGLLKNLEKEGHEGSRAFYLEAWNGKGRFTYDRIGRGTIEIEAACISLLGSIQPGPLSTYLRDVLTGGAGDDGLLQRFQLLVWPDISETWKDVDRWPETTARRTAWQTFERLAHATPEDLHAERDPDDPDTVPWLRFTPEAQTEFRDWRAALEHKLRADDLHPALEAHLAKYRKLVPAVALLTHLADQPTGGPVEATPLRRALAWANYLETHANRLYSQILSPELSAAVELDRHIRKGDLPNPFTARDVYRRGWRLLETTGTLSAITLLADLDRIRPERIQNDTGGRPSDLWHVNPKILRSPS